jgi:hypothetical protein
MADSHVTILDLNIETLSDQNGGYLLPSVPGGCYILVVRRVGYEIARLDFIAPTDSLRLNVRLEGLEPEVPVLVPPPGR